MRYGATSGFRIDHDDYTDELLARDPFYQEFLRPIGYFWHANVVLTTRYGETVELSLKRHLKAGAYEHADAGMLDAALPELRAAARIAKGTLDAETRGMVRLMRNRGHPVFEIDAWGRVLSGRTESEDNPACPVRVVGRRLVADRPGGAAGSQSRPRCGHLRTCGRRIGAAPRIERPALFPSGRCQFRAAPATSSSPPPRWRS